MLLGNPTRVTWEMGEIEFDARLILNPDLSVQTWNGWVCPAFDRANAQKLIDYNAKAAAQYGDGSFDTFSWDGDTIVADRDGELERLDGELDDEGVMRWSIGAWSWTWQEVPLTNDEAEAIGVDGRDGRGDITPSMLTEPERRRLEMIRPRFYGEGVVASLADPLDVRDGYFGRPTLRLVQDELDRMGSGLPSAGDPRGEGSDAPLAD